VARLLLTRVPRESADHHYSLLAEGRVLAQGERKQLQETRLSPDSLFDVLKALLAGHGCRLRGVESRGTRVSKRRATRLLLTRVPRHAKIAMARLLLTRVPRHAKIAMALPSANTRRSRRGAKIARALPCATMGSYGRNAKIAMALPSANMGSGGRRADLVREAAFLFIGIKYT